MKVKFLSVLVCLSTLLVCFSGCNSKKTSTIHADWPYYKTSEEIIEASTDIYSGTLKSISFEIIDYKTGTVDRSHDSLSTSRMLYTIYTIEVIDKYKGRSVSEMKISLEGGLVGYKEKEQYDLLKNAGLLRNNSTIPTLGKDTHVLNIGEKYLFCTVKMAGEYELVINPDQFVFEMNSDMAKNIINLLGGNND